jgi:hypothetical protein
MLLIYNPADNRLTPEEMADMHPRWNEFTQGLKDAGMYVAGDALQPPEVATTIRARHGETQITDGPFAETKEYLGGYYLVEAPDLDSVLERAKNMPNVHRGSVEVRPVWDTTQAASSQDQERVRASA